MRKRRRLRWIVGALVVVSMAGLIGVRWMRPVEVSAMPVVRGRAVDAIYATGTVEAERRVLVKAKIGGPVADLQAREGDAIRTGDLLARVDNPMAAFELRRGQVEASAASAQAGQNAPHLAATSAKIAALDAQLAAAKRDLARVQSLVLSGSLASAEEDRARDHVTELVAQQAALRADLTAQKIDLEASANRAQAVASGLATRVWDTDVRAPQDGIVLARYVEPGEVVAVNQALFKLGDVKSLLLEVRIDEADVARVYDGAAGQAASRVAASLDAFPKRSFAGHVVMVLPDADRETKSYLAKVRLDDPPAGLRSGMTAEVNILVAEREGVLLAPADAIKDSQVWRIADGRAERRKVTVGIHDLLRAEIVSGLEQGDVVAIGGTQLLAHDKTRVRATIQNADVFASPAADGTASR